MRQTRVNTTLRNHSLNLVPSNRFGVSITVVEVPYRKSHYHYCATYHTLFYIIIVLTLYPSHIYRCSTKSLQFVSTGYSQICKRCKFQESFCEATKARQRPAGRQGCPWLKLEPRADRMASGSDGNASVISARRSAEMVNFNQIVYFGDISLTL